MGVDPPLKKCDVTQTCVDTTDVFVTGQKFATREEAISWIKDVGIRNKVTVIIARSDIKTGKRGRSDKLIFGCDRGGKYKKTDSETQSASKRCGCPFKIRSTSSKDGSGWKIDVKCGVHNHGLPDRFEGHAFVSRLNTDDKQHIVDLTKRHVPPRHILLSLQERDPENVTRITQIYKHKSKIQKDIRGPRTEMQQLLKLVEESGYVYWSRKKDESEVTNKYTQPLFEIVGMTSTKLTFAVAFAYMEYEQTETFCWVLDKLKQLFIKQDNCPQVILTDRDLALMKAIETIFPKTANLLCRFHINKNVKSRCKEHVVDDMRETVEKMWFELIKASDEMEYHQRLKQLEDACVDSKGFIDYVNDTWLTPHRHRFFEAWINQVLHLGNTTTNRVESAHWKLKKMLENSLGDLCKCWEAMNDNIKIQVGNIRASFQKSFYEVEHAHTSPFYSNLRGSVSRAALRQIAEEWLRIDMVGTDTQKCGCTHRKVYGLPCACELGRYTLSGDAIPIEAIHIHWRKLSMEGNQDIDADDGSEIDMTNAIDEIWKMWRSLDVVGKRALKSRVCAIAYPTTTKMCPPPEKIKTKGGVKKKGKRPVGYDVYRDPSGYEYVDQSHLSSQKSSKRLYSQLSQTSKNREFDKYIVQFPDYIRPFIDDIVDVRDDGNCGFRAIASLHGYGTDGWSMVRRDLEKEIIGPRSKLYEDLFGQRLPTVRSSLVIETLGQQPPNKWMMLPELGYVIANRYNVVLVSLGHLSLSYFPMTSAHSPNASIYCIGFVNGNHWVQVNMNEGFTLPPVTTDWTKYRTKDATSWMVGFAGRLQHWQRLMPILPKYVSLD
ncbi:PKS-NRPS hybrid synthetase cheA-like [Vicia villosa]|uniref:PKS-NRPS hybrid synthetase cheA-like n=1 Tax=Vicia villosa TaxID=3911 RepID=UPI00273AC2DF|nr:PKS-NRPS hybrid synthetase cheA-like [Vicia villosa]